MRKVIIMLAISASIFACEDKEKMAQRYMQVLRDEIKAAEDFFQDHDFCRSSLIYEKAMTICFKLERGGFVPINEDFKFQRFRIVLGKNLSEAFAKEEFDTMENRLQKVFECIK